MSLRLKFDVESEKVGPGIPINDLGVKKCQKRAKKRNFGPNMGELKKMLLLLFFP